MNGVAAGGGFGLAVCGDVVIAAESAKFVAACARIGAALDGAFTYFVPRLIGMRRAQELYFTDRTLKAREALEWGLVTRVVADAELAAAAATLAAHLAAGPTRAFGLAKRLFHESLGGGLETQMERESQAIARSALTEDWANATKACVEKRKAQARRGSSPSPTSPSSCATSPIQRASPSSRMARKRSLTCGGTRGTRAMPTPEL